MPNISGIIKSSCPIDNRNEIFRKIKEVQAISGIDYIHKAFTSDYCVIVNTLTGLIKTTLDQPAVDPTENTILFLEGEIFNTDELHGHIRENKNLSSCELLLSLFLKFGYDFVTRLNGEFNIIIYQKKENRLVILNDHLASKPMYYMEQKEGLLFGSEKKTILSVSNNSATVDPIGILQAFSFGYNLGDKTFIDRLKWLPSGSRLEYYQGAISLFRHTLMQFDTPRSLPKFESLVEEWCSLMKQAAICRLKNKERILINLSGGLDSRAVACAIPPGLHHITARTRGPKNSLEVKYASEIASRLSFDHYREEPTTLLPSEILHKIVWRNECTAIFTNCLSIANHSVMKQYGDFLISGVLGGAIKGYNYPHLLLPINRNEFLQKAFRWFQWKPMSALAEIFNEEFLINNWRALKESFFDSFAPFEGETNKKLYETWNLHNYQSRMNLSTGSVDSYYFEHIRPLLDKNNLNFVLKLPTRLRFGQILYQAMIYRLGYNLRDIPHVNTNLKVSDSPLVLEINNLRTTLKKAYIKIYKRIWGRKDLGYKDAVLEHPDTIIRQDMAFRNIIEEFVQSTFFDSSIFNGKGILNMLEKHYRGHSNYWWHLSMLATFAVGIQYFIYSKPKSCPPEGEPLA